MGHAIGNHASKVIKSPRPLRAALDRERSLITNKHTDILNCIPHVKVNINRHTNGQTADRRTDATKCIISLASWSINMCMGHAVQSNTPDFKVRIQAHHPFTSGKDVGHVVGSHACDFK